MRTLQVAVFILGAVSFFAALFFVGDDTGDVLWRLGVAAMFTDLALTKLWPQTRG